MIKKISKYIISSLAILVLSCPMIYTTSARQFGDMRGVKGIGTYGTNDYQEDSLIHTIRKAINRVLGLLAFICLCLTIYAGFLMLTSGGDSKKYGEGFSIIKNAAIGLAIIAVSRLIVSLIFYVINTSVVTKSEIEI